MGEEIATDNDARAVVRALIGAVRAWRVVPLLLEVDNGSECKNRLLQAFCRNVGIHLFHTTPYHPQTNGKQERSFRSQQEEFWRSLGTTDLEEIRRLRREFVLRWNTDGGQQALDGRPPCSRLVPGDRRDLDYARLEDLARAPLGSRVVDRKGWIAYMGHRVRVGKRFEGQRADLVLTLEGAEALVGGVLGTRFDYWAHAAPVFDLLLLSTKDGHHGIREQAHDKQSENSARCRRRIVDIYVHLDTALRSAYRRGIFIC